MPAALKGPLLAHFNHHLPLPRRNICLITHRFGTSSRPPNFLLQTLQKSRIRRIHTIILTYRQFGQFSSISQYPSIRHQVFLPQLCVVQLWKIPLGRVDTTSKRTIKVNYHPLTESGACLGPQHSGFTSWRAVIIIGITAGTFILQLYYMKSVTEEGEILETRTKYSELKKSALGVLREDWSDMTGKELPGRPGNLTPEQEEKLREIWAVTLQVFGVLEARKVPLVNGNGKIVPVTGSHPSSETLTTEKPKRKRITLFGRKHRDIETESLTTVEPVSPSTFPLSPGLLTDSDDKYGQTKQFHDTLAQQTPDSLRAAFWSTVKHDHPDGLLLRFLRARKWDVEKALVMMVSTMHWRSKDMHVDDDIMSSGEEAALVASQSSNPAIKKSGEDFLAQMRMGKSFLHGIDKSERPMCFVRVRLHKQGEQTEESLERYTVFVIESARMILAPPVDTACIVFDMTGFSLANMDYSPVKFMIKCFEANYPESLGVVLVHKAPWVFQGIWKIIRGWLDPVVASKVHFTNNVDELEEFVPKSQIPKELGGDENWSYHYVEPLANENELMKDTEARDRLLAEREIIVKDYENSTMEWINHGAPSEASAIKANRHKLANDLKGNYWKLDPYIRARSFYDRVGMIQNGGKVCFYPTNQIETGATISGSTPKGEHSLDDVD